MFDNAYGYILISAILLLETIGFLLIRRIVAIDV
jgi:Flp pilus assembly protein TadB